MPKSRLNNAHVKRKRAAKRSKMRYKALIAVFITIVTLSACNKKLNTAFIAKTEQNGQVFCSLERTPCYGKCPIYDITIYQNGLVKKYNRRFTENDGATLYGKLDNKALQRVEKKAVELNIMGLDSLYPVGGGVADLPGWVLKVKLGNSFKIISHLGTGAPDNLEGFITLVDNTAKNSAVNSIKK